MIIHLLMYAEPLSSEAESNNVSALRNILYSLLLLMIEYYYDDDIKENKVQRACGMYRRDTKLTQTISS
jgi:hypothetical protein